MKRTKARPSLTRPLTALLRDVASRLPEFAHLDPERILVVAGEARRASHASVRPMHFPRTHGRISHSGEREKPVVRIGGKEILYVVTLRPLWFRALTPEQRVGTLLHELFHLSRRFDGTLHPGRRHAAMGKRFGEKLRPLVRQYLREAPPKVLAPFAHHGLVRVQMWLERPPASFARGATHVRKIYGEEQLFLGLMRMVSRPD